jgi:Fe-S cluster assembly protein SufD
MSILLDSLKPEFISLQNSWKEQRNSAWETLEKSGLPGSKNEEWKYTSLQDLDSKAFVTKTAGKLNYSSLELITRFDAYTLVLCNGQVVENNLPAGIKFQALSACEKALQDAFWNAPSIVGQDALSQLNVALCADPLVLTMAAGKSLDKPVHVVHLFDGNEKEVFTATRILVNLEKNAQLTLAESYFTFGKHTSFSNDFTIALLNTDANFTYYKIQKDEGEASHVGSTEIIHLGKSVSTSITISLSGVLTRNNLNLIFKAPHCEGHMYGLYLSNGAQHIDNHTVADHAVPNCFSNELYKGILDDESTGVFNGKIFVRQDAQKTNAFQSNKNVLLSKNASVNTKPQLEIFADDVKCSHGATTGQLDETALFYMRARGIGEYMAKVLLMQAFANDILEKIEAEDLRALLMETIEKRLTK